MIRRSNLIVAALIVLSSAIGSSPLATAADVTLTKGKTTVKVAVGNDVLGAYHFSPKYKKPYMIAVSAPGGADVLAQEVAQQAQKTHELSGKVFVASEEVKLKGSDQTATFAEILDVGKIDDGWLYIDSHKGWISMGDVVPLGVMVTRVVEDTPSSKEYDHVHHKGIWNTVDEVNGIKFWKEDGRIENRKVDLVTPSGNPAVMRVHNQWLSDAGEAVLNEVTTISIYANRLYVYDVEFSPAGNEVLFEDTKEGLFAIRMPRTMTEDVGKGPVVNAEGIKGTKPCWGKESAWIDYVGPIGTNNFGLTMMDHPENPWKSRYHVRGYGLFSINPFGAKAYTEGTSDPQPANHLTLKKGESFRAKYGLHIRLSKSDENNIEQIYSEFVGTEK